MNLENDGAVHTADDAAVDGAVIDGQQAVADDRAEAAYQPTPYDDLAKELGWRSPDEYQGNEPFRSAEEYIKTAVKGTRSVRKDLKDMKQTLERVVKTSAIATEKAVKAERERLEAEYEARVEAGDAKGARQIDREISKLDREAANPVNYEQDFASRNPWYGKDDEATAYAVSVSQRAAASGKTPEEQLEAAEAAVRKRFPELYDEPERKTLTPRKAPAVNTPTTRTASLQPREKGFAELPEAAKRSWAQFDKDFRSRGFKDGYPKDEYAKDYWQEAG